MEALAVLAQPLAMIGEEHHDRPVVDAQPPELGEQVADPAASAAAISPS